MGRARPVTGQNSDSPSTPAVDRCAEGRYFYFFATRSQAPLAFGDINGPKETWAGEKKPLPVLHQRRLPAAGLRGLQGRARA